MTEKKKLFEELFTIFMWIAIGYITYRGVMLTSSPNLFKELQGEWLLFVAMAGTDYFAFVTIYYVSEKDAKRHDTARSPKAGTIMRRIVGLARRAIVPLTIVLTVFMTIYFFIVFIASAFFLMLSKSLMLYIIFTTTVLIYFMVMYLGIEVWRYKRAHKPIGTT